MKPRHVAQAALWFGFGQREFNDGLYGNLPDRFDDVIGAADQSSTVADQHVAACGACITGVTGNGEDVTRLIKRVVGGDQAAGFCGSFNHDSCASKA